MVELCLPWLQLRHCTPKPSTSVTPCWSKWRTSANKTHSMRLWCLRIRKKNLAGCLYACLAFIKIHTKTLLQASGFTAGKIFHPIQSQYSGKRQNPSLHQFVTRFTSAKEMTYRNRIAEKHDRARLKNGNHRRLRSHCTRIRNASDENKAPRSTRLYMTRPCLQYIVELREPSPGQHHGLHLFLLRD